MTINITEARQITTYLHIAAPTTHADLGIVFGTRLPDPAFIAAALLKRGAVPYVALTGGVNRLTGINEARAHRDILLAAGIPPERIIVEDESGNTLENVLFVRERIAERLDLGAIRTILVIAKWFHCRRAIMTLKRHFPPGIRYYTRTYSPDGITPQNWYLTPETAAKVLKNWHGIPIYLEQGHIAEIEKVNGAYE